MATAPLIAAEENYDVRSSVSGNGGPHQPQAIAPAADVAPRRKLVCGQGSQLALVVVLALSCGALGGYYVYTRIFNRCPHGEPCISVPTLGSVFGVPSTRYSTVNWFYNIPYALPPVGALRWQSPVPHGPFSGGVHDGSMPGNACVQPCDMFGPYIVNGTIITSCKNLNWTPQSEDCLNLNVAVPDPAYAPADGAPLPVMLWIHGGGLSNGAGMWYAADALVSTSNHSVIVVTINYRLGALGFMGSTALAARGSALTKDGRNSTGNYGIEDQRMAMRWVQQHIAAFGGDPKKVTIFGESAGGLSVLQHLVQKPSFDGAGAGLYKHAIFESAEAGVNTFATAEAAYATTLTNAGCADVDCLLAMNAWELCSAFPNFFHGGKVLPVIDMVSLDGNPYQLFDAGDYNVDARIILGHNRYEWALFMGDSPPAKNYTYADFVTKLNAVDGGPFNETVLARVVELYANGTAEGISYPERGWRSFWWWAAAAAASDAEWGLGACTVRRVARMLYAANSSAVYGYAFMHAAHHAYTDGLIGWNGTGPPFFYDTPRNKVCTHGMEIEYVFGDVRGVMPGEEAALAATMGNMWANFAKTGTPSSMWPLYTMNMKTEAPNTMMHFNTASQGGVHPVTNYRERQCDFWDSIKGPVDAGLSAHP